MPVSVRTLSQLPGISADQLMPNAKLEVSVPVELSSFDGQNKIWRYASKSITAEELSKKFQSNVRDTLVNENGLTKEIRVDDLCSFVSAMANDDFSFDGEKNFLKNPVIDNSSISTYSLTDDSLDNYSVNYGTLKKFSTINSAPAIGPNFGFITRLSGFQSGSEETERILNIFKPEQLGGEWKLSNRPYFVFNTGIKNVYTDEYIFKIKRGERESASWKAPASGIFTCYGWLDETNNPSQSNETRWVALMGRQAQLGETGWTILQVQPFIKNNYLSYVGFTFPVKKEMELKVVTGFPVGSNSDKYFASNNSLANHVANAFLGGVYTGLSADKGDGTDYDYTDLSVDYATSADLFAISSEIIAHEASCDLSISQMITDLSNKLSNIVVDPDSGETIDVAAISAEISARVKYVDPATLSGDNPIVQSHIVFGQGKEFGVFNPNVKQRSISIPGSEEEQYQCLSINFFENADRPFSYREYYAPPTYSEIRDARVGNVERAYYVADLPGGKVASDGQYFYYRTTQDCTVMVKFATDANSPAKNIVFGWMLYDTERGYANIKALPILEKQEMVIYNGYPSETTTLPVKKGTVLMFGLYQRQRISSTIPWYIDHIQPPVLFLGSHISPTLLNTLRTNNEYLSCEYGYHKDTTAATVNRIAGLLNADGSNINVFYANPDDESHYKLADASFGNVCDIYELP